jgi:hypothetical protein
VNEGRCGVCLGNREDLPGGNFGCVRGKLKLCHIGKLKNSWRSLFILATFAAICNAIFSLFLTKCFGDKNRKKIVLEITAKITSIDGNME